MPATQQILRYRVFETIGEGGFGRVYRAHDEASSRDVALKVLRPGTLDAERAEDLLREARVVAGLRHPSIVAVYACGVFDGAPYFAMELLEGLTLAEHLEQRGAAPVDEALAWAQAILGGLAAAHAAGVVHGDVHPGNLFLTRGGAIKILDFGSGVTAAAQVRQAEASRRVFGAAGFIAPELYLGEAPTPRADLYALGATLFRALAGRLPFAGDTVEAHRQQVLRERAPSLAALAPHVPRWICDVVDRALARDPDARFADAAAFAAAIAGHRDAPPIVTRSVLVPVARSIGHEGETAPSPAPRRRWWWLAAAFVVGAIAAGGIMLGRRDRGETRRGRLEGTQTCGQNERLRIVDARIEAPGTTGIVARDGCELEVIDSVIVAERGIEMSGDEGVVRGTRFEGRRGITIAWGEVVIEGGTFDVDEGVVVDVHGQLTVRASTLRARALGIGVADGGDLKLEDTRIEAPVGIELGAATTLVMTKSDVVATDVAIASEGGSVTANGCTIVGDVGIRGAETIRLHGGHLEGRHAAFVLSADGTAELPNTTVVGRRQRATIEGGVDELR